MERESDYRSMTMTQQRAWDAMMLRGWDSYMERTVKENRYWDELRIAREGALAPRPRVKRDSRKIRKVWKQIEAERSGPI